MGTTITPYQALAYAEKFVKRMPVEDVYVSIANDVGRRIWQAGNWAWSVNSTSAITVPLSSTGGAQTVSFTALTVPVGRFIEGVLLHGLATGGGRTDSTEHLTPVGLVPDTTLCGKPNTFQYTAGSPNDSIKLNVKPAYPVDGTFYGLYKKVYPTLTAKTLHSTSSSLVQQIPDDWYHVWQDGILWRFFEYAGDDRAGRMQVSDGGKTAYSGQLGVFQAGLDQMRAFEPQVILDYRLAQEKAL